VTAEPPLTPQAERTQPSTLRASIGQLVFFGVALVVYVWILAVLELRLGFGGFLHSAATNGFLLVMACWYAKRHPLRAVSLRGSGRLSVALALGLAAAAFAAILTRANQPSEAARTHLASMISLVVLVPLAEELFFRGALFDHLILNVGRIAAVILVSLLFGLLHAPQGTFVPMVALSLILCGVTLAFRSVLAAIAVHAAWNACGVAFRLYEVRHDSVLIVLAGTMMILVVWSLCFRENPHAKQSARPSVP
jgi:membrane protease YdiL (CAAX protease family)